LAEGRFSTLSLSAGQKRRLALSVALAENRPVIILDEFAADQDPENRTYFYDVLIPELAATGQLVIAVTHDDHQFGKCDRLIKMENGHIVSDQRMSSDSERVV
jgi:putative ATP-binding cassette transporter